MPPATLPASRVRGGLAELLEAFEFTRTAKGDPWYFAIELSVLIAAGLSVNHIRWLMQNAYVKHGISRLSRRGRKPSVERVDWHRFDISSCFVLTPAGAKFARPICNAAPAVDAAVAPPEPVAVPPIKTGRRGTPFWDSDQRQLLFEGEIIIEPKRDAPILETILIAFQKAGWESTIPNPLAKVEDENSRTSLHNAVNSLNSHQRIKRIHFSASKRGITWQPVKARRQSRPPTRGRPRPTSGRVSNKKRSANRASKRSAKRQ